MGKHSASLRKMQQGQKASCSLFEDYDESAERLGVDTLLEPAKFERKREAELVKLWWLWAERVGMLRLEEWERFVKRHSQLTCALRRIPIWWMEPTNRWKEGVYEQFKEEIKVTELPENFEDNSRFFLDTEF